MALVAYSDDSDLESDSEEVEENISCVQNELKTKSPTEWIRPEVPPLPKSKNPRSTLEKSKLSSGVDDIIVDDDDDVNHLVDKPTSLLASIPAAIPIDRSRSADEIGDAEDELTDVPTVDTWKVTVDLKRGGDDAKQRLAEKSDPKSKSAFTASKKKEKSKVKFYVPALSEFDEDEEEEEPDAEPERKKMKPSATGTGLFSVLPEPMHISVKETKRPLIPYILTKAPPAPKPAKPKPKPVLEKKMEILEDSDDDDEGPADFFSLSESKADKIEFASVPLPVVKTSVIDVPVGGAELPQVGVTMKETSHRYEEQIAGEPIINEMQEESTYLYQPQVQSEGASGIDQESMIRLMGKRRGKGETINFIDVSADDALLTRDEWMTKALTEEKPAHSFSKKKEGLPSQKQKQKHQITYLAHQAKEREIELKNNWAQSRMTKMQTQAKYGF